MAEPKSTGEAIRTVRRALYDLARQPHAHERGATQPEIINFALGKGWPVPVRELERLLAQLVAEDEAEGGVPWGVVGEGSVLEGRYRLTTTGEVAEERRRRSWLLQVVDELGKPRTFVELIFLGVGFALGLLSGLLSGLLFAPR